MALTFLEPFFLFLLVGVPALWLVPRHARGRTQALVRTLAIVCLVLAMAKPALLTVRGGAYQVIVLDRSASVDAERQARQQALARQLARRVADRRRLSIVTVGADSRAGAGASRAEALSDAGLDAAAAIHVHDPRSRSSLGAALAAAARQVPDGAHGRISLLSDGLSTDRQWGSVVQELLARGLRVDTYDLGRDERDVYPAAVRGDAVMRVGQTARVDVEVVGTARDVRVRLRGPAGEELAVSDPMNVDGRATVPLEFEPARAGFLTVAAQVMVAPAHDSNPGNNTRVHTLAIQDPLRVLYLGDRVRNGAGALAALLGRGFEVDDGGGPAAGTRLGGGDLDQGAYRLAVIDDAPARTVPDDVQRRLVRAVTSQGLGVLFSGGRSAFDAGGYDRTPLATILPVDFTPRTEKRDPSTSLAIVMDTSGSMGGTRIELARQVARLAVRRLKAHDRIGIVEFYGNKHWALPLQSAANKITIDRAIGRMQAIGGTVLLPAIEEAYYGLKNVDTRYKHILIITDAGIEEAGYDSLLRLVTKSGVNVSTVLVGAQGHSQIMIDMAAWGKGRFYSAVDRYTLPELILKQPSTMKLPTYRSGRFDVRGYGGAGWWSDVDRELLPPLSGYVETTSRSGAEVLMEIAASAHPLLATWRYGLGRVTALMTEPVGEGTRGWQQWDDYGRLLARIASRTADDSEPFRYALRREGPELTVSAWRSNGDASSVPEIVVVDPQGRESERLSIRQQTPDGFEASAIVDPSEDVRLMAMTAKRATDTTASGTTAAVRDRRATRLISRSSDDLSPEDQVDPRRGLDLAGLARATGGTYVDAGTRADARARVEDEADATSGRMPGSDGSLDLVRLWPALVLAALAIYLVEITYRRWPRERGRQT